MKTLKKIIYVLITLCFSALTSCTKKGNSKSSSKIITTGSTAISPTPYLVFCANAMYDSKEDLPEIVLSYCSYEDFYEDDVTLFFLLGQTSSIWVGGNKEKIYNDIIIPHDDKNYKYMLCEVDTNNNKLGFEKELWTYGIDSSGTGLTFTNPYGKYVLYCWFESNRNKVIIPKESFLEEKGVINLSVFKINKNNKNEETLVTISIEYTNDGQYIRLIPPKNSFSGKDGLTDKERFSWFII